MVKRMKNGKAVGPDDIPVEVKLEHWSSLRNCTTERLVPEFLIPMNKGDVSCSNYRGIKLIRQHEAMGKSG